MSMSRGADRSAAFLIGANLPWVHYGIDFGANAWRPSGGIAQPAEQAHLDAVFAQLEASGVQWVRWFLFCDGRAGIVFSPGGHPLGLDDLVFRDVDAALDIARRHRISIMFTLFDFLWCDAASGTRGVQMGGRARVIADDASRGTLLENVVRPVLERYHNEPQIFAWDIINEPEWITSIDAAALQSFFTESVSLVHAVARQPVTIGSAGVRWRDRYAGLGLDFYQVHWYDSIRHQPPLETPVRELGFDRPVLLGEFPTRGSRRTPEAIIDTARVAGYSGAFYWSVLSKDECSAYPISSSALIPERMP
jgi:hypothetical protein